MGDYTKHTIESYSNGEQFTIDKGDGNGYEVYYHRKNGYWWYTVTYNDNGCRAYSKTHRLPKEMYEEMRAQSLNVFRQENK